LVKNDTELTCDANNSGFFAMSWTTITWSMPGRRCFDFSRYGKAFPGACSTMLASLRSVKFRSVSELLWIANALPEFLQAWFRRRYCTCPRRLAAVFQSAIMLPAKDADIQTREESVYYAARWLTNRLMT